MMKFDEKLYSNNPEQNVMIKYYSKQKQVDYAASNRQMSVFKSFLQQLEILISLEKLAGFDLKADFVKQEWRTLTNWIDRKKPNKMCYRHPLLKTNQNILFIEKQKKYYNKKRRKKYLKIKNRDSFTATNPTFIRHSLHDEFN